MTLSRADPSLINDDIAPVPRSRRTWTVASMASLWIGMVVCVPTYMLAGSLVGEGMSAAQAVIAIMIGNAIVLVPMVLIGHAGTAYGVPFPVLLRASFGIRGAHVPSLLRALVACGWFGIQTWLGGAAIHGLLAGVIETGGAAIPVLGITAVQLACYLAFWAVQVWIIWRGVESIRIFEQLAAPFLIVMGLVLLGWAWKTAGGFGEMLTAPSAFVEGGAKEGQLWSVLLPSITAMVSFWGTLSLNIPDFTRYARSQRDQIVGQALGLPTTMTLFAFIAVAVTSSTVVMWGEPVWDPTVLLAKMGGGVGIGVSLFALSVATLSTNIAANVVSPANALVALEPRKLSFRTGGLVTAGLGLVMFPWKLLESTGDYINTWLIGYSVLLGPIGGIMIADYWIVRRKRLDLEGLYRKDGPYWYKGGVNRVAMAALVIAMLPNVPGFLHVAGAVDAVPAVFDKIYTYAAFVGFGLGGAIYVVGMRRTCARS